MTRNSTRVYWMTNKNWYKLVDGEFQLTPAAPPRARKSFAEWKTPGKIPGRMRLKYIRTKIALFLRKNRRKHGNICRYV